MSSYCNNRVIWRGTPSTRNPYDVYSFFFHFITKCITFFRTYFMYFFFRCKVGTSSEHNLTVSLKVYPSLSSNG